MKANMSMPRATAGDYERALALMAAVGGDKDIRAYLTELQDATAAYDKARTSAEGAAAVAKSREGIAREAEDRACSGRLALAAETETAREELARRELVVKELERVADERVADQNDRERDIERRVALLRDAGVVFSE